MKVVVVLALATVAAASGGYRSGGNVIVATSGSSGYGGRGDDYVPVDLTYGYSDYHFSWLHDGHQKYEYEHANNYCSSLGYGWHGISIDSSEEDEQVDKVLYEHNIEYIWTDGYKQGYDWVWGSGSRFYPLDWSYTGALNQPQPDNRDGNEDCLAVLNNVYKDGIKWHDVACHHKKPIICERPSSGRGGSGGASQGSGGYGGSGSTVVHGGSAYSGGGSRYGGVQSSGYGGRHGSGYSGGGRRHGGVQSGGHGGRLSSGYGGRNSGGYGSAYARG